MTENDDTAERILDAARTMEPERALARIRLLLAKYGHAQTTSFAPVIEADVYYTCEKIAKRLGADAVATEIRRVGKLDEVTVTECKEEDIRG